MNDLTPITQSNGPALFRASTDAAGLCRDIVVATARNIQGRKYVQVEGWQAIAIAHGCVASSGSVERVEGGFRAIGRVIQMNTGIEIATAEGFVGDDERMWAQRPEYARRAMAQTRAISRACRSAFAHVVVMMNAGLSTTPAEEVPADGFDDAPAPRQAPAPSEDVLKAIASAKTIEDLERLRPQMKGQKALLAAAKAKAEKIRAADNVIDVTPNDEDDIPI